MRIVVNGATYTHEELQKIADACFDRTSFAKVLGFPYFNGKISGKITDIVERYGISIDHFDKSKKTKARRKYPIVKKNCPACGEEFETQVGNKEERITCSYACSNTYFASVRHTDESNKKTSDSLIRWAEETGKSEPGVKRLEANGHIYKVYDKNCLGCERPFQGLKRQSYCGQSCASKTASLQRIIATPYQEGIETVRVINDRSYQLYVRVCDFCKLEFLATTNRARFCSPKCSTESRIANGTHSYWPLRNKLTPSFPEKITIEVLSELNIQLEREHKCGRWFIDFADVNRKIAIEIDGKQHEEPERKAKDEIKDAYLTSQGWQVHRIKWKKLTPESREELKKKLSDILKSSE